MFPGSWHGSRGCGLDRAEREVCHWAANFTRNPADRIYSVIGWCWVFPHLYLVIWIRVHQWRISKISVWIVMSVKRGVKMFVFALVRIRTCLINTVKLFIYNWFCTEQFRKILGNFTSFNLFLISTYECFIINSSNNLYVKEISIQRWGRAVNTIKAILTNLTSVWKDNLGNVFVISFSYGQQTIKSNPIYVVSLCHWALLFYCSMLLNVITLHAGSLTKFRFACWFKITFPFPFLVELTAKTPNKLQP